MSVFASAQLRSPHFDSFVSPIYCPTLYCFMAYPQHVFSPSLRPYSQIPPSLTSPNQTASPLSTPIKEPEPESPFVCTVCWTQHEFPPYVFGHETRIVCLDCWRWIYAVSVCWHCGEVVFRRTDAVRFGWCWWHWACFSCLVCAVDSHYFVPAFTVC